MDAALLSSSTPATLFRRYCCDGTGAPGAVREERIFDSSLQRIVDCLRETPASSGEAYFVALDDGDLERDVALAMIAQRDLAPTLAHIAA